MTTTDSTALATREPTTLSRVTGFTDQQIKLIRETCAPGASTMELAWYLYNAKRLGLEPMLKQIYFIKRGQDQPGTIQIGIDGYRLHAGRSPVYAGNDEPDFEYESDGQPNAAPSKAVVVVWKMVDGQRVPFSGVARWKEYYPGDGKVGTMWRKMPHNQLAKCAEAQALRKAFPAETMSLDVPQELPSQWREAAAEADRPKPIDPERTKMLAARQEEIFGTEGRAYADQPAETPDAEE